MAKFSGFMILTSVSPWPAPPTIDMSTGRGAALPPKAVAAAVADEAVAAAVAAAVPVATWRNVGCGTE